MRMRISMIAAVTVAIAVGIAVGYHTTPLQGQARTTFAAVAGENRHVRELLDACEHHIAGRPEVELLSVRRRVFGPEDE